MAFSKEAKYAAIFVLLIFIIISFVIISGPQQTTEPATVTLTAFDKSILGSRLDPALLKKQHVHADFAVFVNGQQVDFNDEKYFEKSVFMHAEDDSDGSGGKKLHLHSTNVPLWVFFESVGMNFNKNCITLDSGENFCGQLKFFVNGQENDEYEKYVFKNGDRVLISINSIDIEKEMDAVTSYALAEIEDFRQLCISDGREWVEMKPMIDGKATSSYMCAGCMVDDSHFCDPDEYRKFVSK